MLVRNVSFIALENQILWQFSIWVDKKTPNANKINYSVSCRSYKLLISTVLGNGSLFYQKWAEHSFCNRIFLYKNYKNILEPLICFDCMNHLNAIQPQKSIYSSSMDWCIDKKIPYKKMYFYVSASTKSKMS